MNEVNMTAEISLLGVIGALGIAFFIYWNRTKHKGNPGPEVPLLQPDMLLKVVSEQIGALSTRIDNLADSTSTSRTAISAQIDAAIVATRDVFDQGAELRDTTTRIATALKGTGQRGSWGEVQLERVIELAGLTEHVTYKSQKTFKTDEEKDRTPDLTVFLPDNRLIPVDAKAPDLNLDGEESTAAENLKNHIKKLSARKYPTHIPGAIDFVVLFVPTESTLASALGEDPNLIEFAFKANILLTSPLTLLAMLRVVEYGWQQLSQIENVAIISETAHSLCERSLILVEHLAGVQKGLSEAVEGYNKAANSANSRLLPAVVQMRDLGIRTEKAVPELKVITTIMTDPPK